MPRTRFVWRLFSALCAVAAVTLLGCFWVASVHVARLADAALLRRLGDATTAVVKLLPASESTVDPAAFRVAAEAVQQTARVELSLLDLDGGLIMTAVPPTGTGAERAEAVALALRSDTFLADAREGRTATASSYDVASGRRVLVMAIPLEIGRAHV